MNKLKNQYMSKCFSEMLITDVVDILDTSSIILNPRTSEGESNTCIKCIVEGVVFEPGDIITDARINNITNSIASATSQYATININLSNTTTILKVGDVTPVIVTLAQYNIFSPSISIVARPFLPNPVKNICIYKCIGKAENLENLMKLRQQYQKQLDGLTGPKKKSLQFFQDLLSYKDEKWDKLVPGSRADNFVTVPRDGDIIYLPVTRWPHISDKVYFTKSWREDPTPIDIDKYAFIHTKGATSDVYGVLLMRYIKSMAALVELVETYPDQAAINGSSHIWNYFKKIKSSLV